MGSYATFKINDYEIFSMKSYVDSSIMSVFSENDKKECIKRDGEDPECENKNIIYQNDDGSKISNEDQDVEHI